MRNSDKAAARTQGRMVWLVAALAFVSSGALVADGREGTVWPEMSGVYFENNGQNDWVPVRAEQAKMAAMTARGEVVQARLPRGYSRATLYAPLRLAVRVHPLEEVAGYRVYRLRANGDARDVRFRKPINVEWREIGPELYELRLPAELPAGDYAVLPPGDSADRVYAFRYEPLRLPRNQGFAFR